MPVEVTPELLARHDRPGPRYTSYPTAVEFHDGVGAVDADRHLRLAADETDEPISLYVHLPFCDARCAFCGCHVVVARRPEVAAGYLPRVVAEADLVLDRLDGRRRLAQLHWGGGTPTKYSPDDLAWLFGQLTERFELTPDAEVAIEIDPRITTVEHLHTLHGLGFNRISMGVQDTDDRVQDLIGRHQTWDQTRSSYETVRSLGGTSINIDLIYGLPGQSEASFTRTLEQVIELRPDRLAVYSFAFVPWMRKQQQRMDTDLLPGRDEKFALLALAIAALEGAGYQRIGMDHFALPTDELARARTGGALSRTFMGYTVLTVDDVVGLGTSAISDVQGAYLADHRRLASYLTDVDEGRLPTERGVVLDADDRVRRAVITSLMCNDVVDIAATEARFGIDFADYFASELADLRVPGGLVDEGFVTVRDDEVRASELGSLFIRNIAIVFDRYRRPGAKPVSGPTFSRTV